MVLNEFVRAGLIWDNWFVIAYIMLMIMTPLIEKSLESISIKQFSYWIFLLSLFNIIFGFLGGKVSPDGYNAVHFIYLYYLSRFARQAIEEGKMDVNLSKYGLLLYTVFSILLFICFIAIFFIGFSVNSKHWFAYNNPLLILSSLFLFLWFYRLKIDSKVVNIMATGVFGVYILHTNLYIRPLRDEITANIFYYYSYGGIIIETITIFFICIIIGFVINILTSHVTNWIYGRVSSYLTIYWTKHIEKYGNL